MKATTDIERKTFIISSGEQIKQDNTLGAAHLDIATRKQICFRHNKCLGVRIRERTSCAGNNNIYVCLYRAHTDRWWSVIRTKINLPSNGVYESQIKSDAFYHLIYRYYLVDLCLACYDITILMIILLWFIIAYNAAILRGTQWKSFGGPDHFEIFIIHKINNNLQNPKLLH